MKKILTLLLLLPLLSIAQVGVNTTTPRAALDVESTNNGVLIPRVQLTSILDNTTIVNPNAGPLETSTLVYNIAPAGVVPNNIVAGFYYWNGSQWTAIAGNASSDHDWYEVGTTTAPNAITDDIFHTGNVAIGKNTADYPLEVNTTNFQFGINNILNNPTASNTQKATINNTITDDTNDSKYGIINTVTNNSTTSGGVGVRNNINGNGTVFYGNSNYLTAGTNSNGADIIGVRNDIDHNSNNSNVKGMYNIFNGTYGNLNLFNGLENDFRVSALRKTGVNNIFNANTDGFNVGMYNVLSCNLPINNQYGVWNNIVTGINNNSGDNYGLYNYFSGNGNSSKIGSYTTIDSNGDGQHIGSLQFINGSATGLGTKYGTLTTIISNAGGVHYGIHSTVLKPGATNFAGYFLGNVGIGTTTTNTYTFPPSRGTNGQIMQTDAAGNVTWQNPMISTAWDLNGNTAITSPVAPATYGSSTIGGTENFIGTIDNNDVTIGTNTIERMRVLSTGNIGIGTANPSVPFEVTSFGTNEFRLSSRNAFGTARFSFISDKELATEWRPSYIESGDNGSFTGRMDFFTNGTGVANRFGSVRAMSIVNGNVGINTSNPTLAKLQVEGIVGNTSAIFRGNAATSQGISMVADWPGIYINSYFNGGIRSMSSTGFPSIINTDQSNGSLFFQTTNVSNTVANGLISSIPIRMTIAGNGNVGIGTTGIPTNLLHINSTTAGAVRIVDGTEGNGRVLTSNGIGVATWQVPINTTSWLLTGNTAITSPAIPASYGISPITPSENFMGTTDNNDVVIGTNTIERMRVLSTGNIGIGLATSPARLSVFRAFLSPTIPNTTTNAMLRIGNNNEGLDIGKAGSAGNFAAWLQSGFSGTSEPMSLQPLGGNVGIATTNPTNLLHINSASTGAVRIVDGTQAAGRVLTSDAAGVGTWQNSRIDNVLGTLSATGVSLPFNLTTFVQTGSSITLPPGRFAVNVTMLLARNSTTLPSPNNSFFWVRSSFSDSPLANPLPSGDITGSNLASGNFTGTSIYAMLIGTIIINNTTPGNRTYYYVAGRCVTSNTTETLTNFGSSVWAEDSIIAYRLN